MRKKKENKYYKELKFLDGEKKLSLTRDNVDFIEAVLRIDSRYKNFSNENDRPSIEYVKYLQGNKENKNLYKYGSSSYWIKQFIEIIKIIKINKNSEETIIDTLRLEKKNQKYNQEKGLNFNSEEEIELDLNTIISGMVYSIDRENSTRLSAHRSGNKEGRKNVSEKIYEYIKKNNIEKFIKQLTRKDDFSLIGYITVPKNSEKENYHYSFATKFCKYVSNAFDYDKDAMKVFKSENYNYCKDKYYIYDNIIISNIEYYIEEYIIKKENKKEHKEKYKIKELIFNKNDYEKIKDKEKAIAEKYKRFYDCLEKIRQEANERIKKENKDVISRNEFDHLIWYSNK